MGYDCVGLRLTVKSIWDVEEDRAFFKCLIFGNFKRVWVGKPPATTRHHPWDLARALASRF